MKRWTLTLIGLIGMGMLAACGKSLPMVSPLPGTETTVSLLPCPAAPRPGWERWLTGTYIGRVGALYQEGGTLWIGTAPGIQKLDVASGRLTAALPTVRVRNFLPAGDGRIWASSEDGLAYFDGETWRLVPFSEELSDFPPITEMAFNRKENSLWLKFGARRSMFPYLMTPVEIAESGFLEMRKIETMTEIDPEDCESWQSFSNQGRGFDSPESCRIRQSAWAEIGRAIGSYPSFIEVGKEGVWWAKNGWFGLWDGKENREWMLDGDDINLMESAADGGVWLAYKHGLVYFNPQTGEARRVHLEEDPACVLLGDPIDVAVDGAGQTWAVTEMAGVGLVRLSEDRRVWVPKKDFWAGDGIFASELAVAPDGALWAVDSGGLWRIEGQKGMKSAYPQKANCTSSLYSLEVDAKGHVWGIVAGCTWDVLEYRPGIYRWVNHGNVNERGILAVGADGQIYLLAGSTLWISQEESWQEIARLPQFENYRAQLISDPTGGMWITEPMPGRIWRYKDGQLTALEGAIKPEELYAAEVDGAGQLWLVTDRAIIRYNGNTRTEFSVPAIPWNPARDLIYTRDGRMWIVWGEELWAFDPANP